MSSAVDPTQNEERSVRCFRLTERSLTWVIRSLGGGYLDQAEMQQCDFALNQQFVLTTAVESYSNGVKSLQVAADVG